MNSIVINLKDPNWWFNAIFIGIIIGVAGGFLKDLIARWASNLFIGLKDWQKKRELKRKEIVEILLNDDTYYKMASLKQTSLDLAFIFMVLFYLVSPLFLTQSHVLKFNNIDNSFLIWEVITPFIGSVASYTGYRAAALTSLMVEVRNKYRKSKNYPEI